MKRIDPILSNCLIELRQFCQTSYLGSLPDRATDATLPKLSLKPNPVFHLTFEAESRESHFDLDDLADLDNLIDLDDLTDLDHFRKNYLFEF